MESKAYPLSREGYRYTVCTDTLTSGLPTPSVLPSTANPNQSRIYDTIVLGAGFTGLSAARDLSLSQPAQRILLLEARDRIGGRTWTAHVDEHRFEMGGTWIHWLQPHVWAEMTRYGLVDGLKVSSGTSEEAEVSYLDDAGTGIAKERPEKTDERLLPLIARFLDVDGRGGKTLFPQPWMPLENREVWAKWDISLAERTDQMGLSDEDRRFLLAWFAINTCAPPEESSFLNIVRLLALSAWDFNTFMEICGKFKMKEGTTALALAMFHEYNGDVLFGKAANRVHCSTDGVEVVTDSGGVYRAQHVVCTIPLHCLADVDFSPPLPSAFTTTKHANFAGKVHIHSAARVEPWFGISNSERDICAAFTDVDSSQRGTHVVSFANGGKLVAKHHVKDNPKAYIQAVQEDVVPPGVRLEATHLTWHDWTRDAFTKGGWASYGPTRLAGPLGDIMRHTRPHERLIMASADWASGWVGYIDGALEMGRRAAKQASEARSYYYSSLL